MSRSKLDTVIKVKNHQVKNAQRELAVITVTKEKEETELDRLEETHNTAMSDAVREMKTRAADLQTGSAFIQNLSRQIKRQEGKVDEIREKEDGKREELIEKSQSKQMIEKLEKKRKEEVEKELDRKAQRVIDMLAQRLRLGF